MSRRSTSGLILAVLFSLAPSARGQTPADLAETGRYVAAFQNADGGFGGQPGGPSSLGATSTAIRVLKNVGGSTRDPLAATDYILRGFDRSSGGFAPTPGGKPDVATTASGLMALAEMRVADDAMVQGAIRYFSANAKDFEQIRIAVASLEAVKKTSPDFDRWAEKVRADRNPDGTWGRGSARARATGGAAVALLRMGQTLDKKDAILSALREAQRPDGGWSGGDGPSSLEATYRIMRCFFMLGEKPDLDRLRGFLARCRHPEGGYGVSPGEPASPGGTYFATTVLRWARLLGGEPALVETAGFQPLFDGRSLTGWEGDTQYWSARDGMIVGTNPGLDHNEFLATTRSYGDFVLKLTFRISGDEGANSGVQFRSVRVPPHEMSGYQADVGQGFWGCLYDESRRNRVLVQASDRARAAIHKDGWNEYVIRAVGDRITLTLNGVPSVQYREADAKIAREGKIALQIHAGKAMKAEFKDLYIQPLPSPAADGSNAPGFHLRTAKAPSGERKYAIFLPTGYDPDRAYPLVFFLHGAGERGEDGVAPTRAGLGPIVAGRPEDFPVIAVFPQARRTWAADSPDARDALAVLDEVRKAHKVDPHRVILTGLSMGGGGSWQIGAEHPEMFSAVAPVCGFGSTETAKALKGMPVWTFLGDNDMDRIVRDTRAMVRALREAGGTVRLTEYRGVGHNSWDRAYSDPELLAWMLAQKRPPRPAGGAAREETR